VDGGAGGLRVSGAVGLRERPGLTARAGIVLAVAGAAVVAWGAVQVESGLGLLFLFLSALSWAVYTILGRRYGDRQSAVGATVVPLVLATVGHRWIGRIGHAARDRRDFCEWLERFKALPIFSADGGEGQDKRTAGRFALLALAGEVATEYGITGWPEGAASEAAAEGFKAWRATRGRGNDERRQILERVSGFIERHGDSRFSDAETHSTDEPMRINRAGWWRDDQAGRVYLFNKDGLREALTGFDFKRALDTLQEAGALPKADASGERAKAQRIGGRLVRLYPIQADKLGGDHGAGRAGHRHDAVGGARRPGDPGRHRAGVDGPGAAPAAHRHVLMSRAAQRLGGLVNG